MSGRVPDDLLARPVADGAPAWNTPADSGPRVVPDPPAACGARAAVEWAAFLAGAVVAWRWLR